MPSACAIHGENCTVGIATRMCFARPAGEEAVLQNAIHPVMTAQCLYCTVLYCDEIAPRYSARHDIYGVSSKTLRCTLLLIYAKDDLIDNCQDCVLAEPLTHVGILVIGGAGIFQLRLKDGFLVQRFSSWGSCCIKVIRPSFLYTS